MRKNKVVFQVQKKKKNHKASALRDWRNNKAGIMLA